MQNALARGCFHPRRCKNTNKRLVDELARMRFSFLFFRLTCPSESTKRLSDGQLCFASRGLGRQSGRLQGSFKVAAVSIIANANGPQHSAYRSDGMMLLRSAFCVARLERNTQAKTQLAQTDRPASSLIVHNPTKNQCRPPRHHIRPFEAVQV